MATRDLIVLKLLRRLGAHAFRTDLMGTIRCLDLACTSEHPARQSTKLSPWKSLIQPIGVLATSGRVARRSKLRSLGQWPLRRLAIKSRASACHGLYWRMLPDTCTATDTSAARSRTTPAIPRRNSLLIAPIAEAF